MGLPRFKREGWGSRAEERGWQCANGGPNGWGIQYGQPLHRLHLLLDRVQLACTCLATHSHKLWASPACSHQWPPSSAGCRTPAQQSPRPCPACAARRVAGSDGGTAELPRLGLASHGSDCSRADCAGKHVRPPCTLTLGPAPQSSPHPAACLPHLHPVSGSTATEPTTIRSTLILSSRERGTPYLTTPAASTGAEAR